jgi:hypothetical protein
LYNTSNTIIDRLLEGAIDFHVHAGPDPVERRRLDALEVARQAKVARMRAVVIKSHNYCTSPLACTINQVVPGFSLIGSIVLNSAVGGLSPEAVEIAIRMMARVIWMPTYSSVVDAKRRQANLASIPLTDRAMDQKGIPLLDKGGGLLPEVVSILEIIKEANAVLSTGHVSIPETYALVEAARDLNIRVTVTHPLNRNYGARLTLRQQLELAGKGALMEHCFLDCMPPPYGGLEITVLAEHIISVGAEHCLLCTDFGQYQNPTPLEGFQMMLAELLKVGISEAELEVMVKTNPTRLLSLE